jgi:hypothetical protein
MENLLSLFLLIGIVILAAVPMHAAAEPVDLASASAATATLGKTEPFACDASDAAWTTVAPGTRTIDGVEWKFQGEGTRPAAWLLKTGTHGDQLRITLDRRATSVHFLHTLSPSAGVAAWRQARAEARTKRLIFPDRPTVFRYNVEYADGVVVPVRVRFAESIHDWNRRLYDPDDGIVGPMGWASVACTIADADEQGRARHIYHMTWPNPRPDKVIRAIVADGRNHEGIDYGTVALVGISTDERGDSAIRFVAPDGDDAADGTFERPWRSLQHGVDRLAPGDTLYVRGGSYRPTQMIRPARSGSEGKWITISGFPGETALIDGHDVVIDKDSRQGIITSVDVSYLRIQNLTLINGQCEGIAVKGNATHLDLLHNIVHFTANSGIGAWRGDEPESMRHVRAIGNILLNTCARAANVQFHNHDKRGGDECLDAGGIADFEYAYNEIGYGDKESIDAKGPVRRGRIHHNYVYRTGSIYVDGWNHPVFEIEVDHNVMHSSYGGYKISTESGTDARDIHVHHNLAYDMIAHGIHITNYGETRGQARKTNIRIENNTLDNCGFGIFVQGQRVKDVIVRNNIITRAKQFAIATAGQDLVETNIVIDHNLVDAWPEGDEKQTPIKGAPLFVADPMYADVASANYYLRPASPAISAGRPNADGSRGELGAYPFKPLNAAAKGANHE